MEAQGYTWDNMKSCTITATAPEFADHVASIPQGADEGILISLTGFSQAINLELRNLSSAGLQEILEFRQKDATTGGGGHR